MMPRGNRALFSNDDVCGMAFRVHRNILEKEKNMAVNMIQCLNNK